MLCVVVPGYLHELSPPPYTTTFIPRPDQSLSHQTSPSYATLRTVVETQDLRPEYDTPPLPPPRSRKSLSMTFTSTGTALSLPPKKKDIYRPYSLEDKPSPPPPPLPPSTIRVPAEEDLHAAHAILDLSASTTVFLPPPPTLPLQEIDQSLEEEKVLHSSQAGGKTIAYTYEAFFVSDGRSKKR